jgi:predicted nucleic acid-binding protein
MKLVLDASVAVAASRRHERSHASARARVARVLRGEDEVILPALFAIEVGAALARAGEPVAAVRAYVESLLATATKVVSLGPRTARRIRDVAMLHRLRAADAIYVWIASREAIPLCTLDEEILKRSVEACEVLEP